MSNMFSLLRNHNYFSKSWTCQIIALDPSITFYVRFAIMIYRTIGNIKTNKLIK